LHDPTIYPEPDVFKPERFLNPDGNLLDDPVLTSSFGYGKRICPGRHLADATLFITVASVLSVFNIERKEGAGGQPSEYSYRGTVIRFAPFPNEKDVMEAISYCYCSRPNSFPCSINPRDKRAEELIIADAMAR
jgi:cytochrome P450